MDVQDQSHTAPHVGFAGTPEPPYYAVIFTSQAAVVTRDKKGARVNPLKIRVSRVDSVPGVRTPTISDHQSWRSADRRLASLGAALF